MAWVSDPFQLPVGRMKVLKSVEVVALESFESYLAQRDFSFIYLIVV